ncbi:MAG: arsenate reductase ArsC [Acidiferrobacterales bacterium]
MSEKIYNVLFLCTGNSCRSVFAECILNRLGYDRFRGYSAGSHPTGEINPYALELLQRFDYPTDQLRSKSWDEFTGPDAPEMDFVVTVCDQAAGEICPVWRGKPMTAYWNFPDPAKFEGTKDQTRAFFQEVYGRISHALSIFVNLPVSSLDETVLKQKLAEIGESINENH